MFPLMDKNTRIELASGNEIPIIGFGTWLLTNDAQQSVENALALGYRLIDTSGDYGTQPAVGAAIRSSGLRRDDLFVVTKVEENEDSYEASRRNLDELAMDYVDLMLIHRPPREGAGEHLWAGLIRAKEEGLARDIGVSSYSTELMSRLFDGSGETPAVNQIEWSPFGWSADMLDFCNNEHIVIQAYSPLTHANRLDDDRLSTIARSYDRSPAQIMLRWDLQRGVVPIPKANQAEHRSENLDVFDFELSDLDMAELDRLNTQSSSLGDGRIIYA